MSAGLAVCDSCGGWVERGNARWPGYCSPECRDAARPAPRPARPTDQPNYNELARRLVHQGLASHAVVEYHVKES